jgi:hypothetical protein
VNEVEPEQRLLHDNLLDMHDDGCSAQSTPTSNLLHPPCHRFSPALQANCWRGHEMLHEQFANRTLDAMRKYNMTTLFVMTHPFIRDFISEKLKQVRGVCVCVWREGWGGGAGAPHSRATTYRQWHSDMGSEACSSVSLQLAGV